jgi:hypothetical protein
MMTATTVKGLLLVTTIVGLGAALTGWSAQGKPDDSDVTAKASFLHPKEGTEVERGQEFEIRATITPALPKGQKVFACVEANGLLWPKEPELSHEKDTWTGFISEGGDPGGMFKVTLIGVPSDGDGVKTLDAWFRDGRRSGDFPGLRLRSIQGARRLGSLSLKLR